MRKFIVNLTRCPSCSKHQPLSLLKNRKTQLPRLFVLLTLLLVLPLGFIARGSATDSPESLADPGKYSDDWRANGPPGGDVRSLVVDPSNPDRLYLGTLDAQIYTFVGH